MKLRYKIINGILIFLGLSITTLAVVISYDSDCIPIAPASEGNSAMQSILSNCYGASEVLQLVSVEKPTPEANEVLVKIKAAAVNPLDWHYMRGSPFIMRLGAGIGAPTDRTVGVDFSGVIEAIGEGVTKFKVGDEVFGGAGGAFAEYVTVNAERAIALKPANMSFEQAASVPVAGLTALQALRDHGLIKPGQKVLINGASGGVGTFAVQIAKAYGAEVTGVCSGRNVDMVRSIGADHVFNYKEEDYTESGQTYDLIIDNVGNHSLSKNRQVLKPGGTIVLVGGEKGDWIAPLIMPLKATVLSPFVDERLVFFVARLTQEDLNYLADLMEKQQLSPVIDRRYSLQEVPDAIEYSEQGRARGKIVINFP